MVHFIHMKNMDMIDGEGAEVLGEGAGHDHGDGHDHEHDHGDGHDHAHDQGDETSTDDARAHGHPQD